MSTFSLHEALPIYKLAAYITSPATAVPGNKMPFGGVKDAAKVANLVAYLQTVK